MAFSLYRNITKAIVVPARSYISVTFQFLKKLVYRSVESEGEKKLFITTTGWHHEWRKSRETGGYAQGGKKAHNLCFGHIDITSNLKICLFQMCLKIQTVHIPDGPTQGRGGLFHQAASRKRAGGGT